MAEGLNKLAHVEQERTYHYADGSSKTFLGIAYVGVTKSGYHRLEAEDGCKFIVAPGWRYITLMVDEWTF
jgi:hypothetical protein